uniref:LD30889p n=1 Tax=Drosophila melanogaster TaxID=7227 RepID=Q95RG5_DROME|nr:LD30889p [Drosophila melanogaster]
MQEIAGIISSCGLKFFFFFFFLNSLSNHTHMHKLCGLTFGYSGEKGTPK